MTQFNFVIGIDGGGSGTRAWLAVVTNQKTEVIGRGQAGIGNPQTSPDVAYEQVNDAVSRAFAQANVSRQKVSSACICLAGIDRPQTEQQVRQWAQSVCLAESITLANDALPILYAANERGTGIAIISGTGSIAFGRNMNGQTARCGGWGPILGDEGSGYSIACQALRAAARCSDGRGPKTELLPRLLSHQNLRSASDLILTVHAADFQRPQIAALASLVFDTCRDGDVVARRIVDDAAKELALAARTVIVDLDLSADEFHLAIAGGVLTHQPLLRQILDAELAATCGRPRTTTIVEQPVLGAIRIAAAHFRSGGLGSQKT